MQKEMREMSPTVKWCNCAAIIVQALKVTTDEAEKRQLKAKLVAMSLEF